MQKSISHQTNLLFLVYSLHPLFLVIFYIQKYFEEHMDYPQAEYIDLFNLIEKLRGDIEILKQEIDGGDDEAAEEDIEDIEE